MPRTNKPKKEKARNLTSAFGDEAAQRLYGSQTLMAEMWTTIKANPHADGWFRLNEILRAASEDERVISSVGASSFLDLIRELAADALTTASAEEAMQPLVNAIKSSNSSAMAVKRFRDHRKAKKWLISEWIKDKAEYKSKAEFVRIYVKRVFNEFGIPMKERNIIDRWLKGL